MTNRQFSLARSRKELIADDMTSQSAIISHGPAENTTKNTSTARWERARERELRVGAGNDDSRECEGQRTTSDANLSLVVFALRAREPHSASSRSASCYDYYCRCYLYTGAGRESGTRENVFSVPWRTSAGAGGQLCDDEKKQQKIKRRLFFVVRRSC